MKGLNCKERTEIASSENIPSQEVVNICSGIGLRLKDFGSAVVKTCEGNGSLLNWGALFYRNNEVMSVVGDPSKAKTLFDWSVKTSLVDGLLQTYQWYKKVREAGA